MLAQLMIRLGKVIEGNDNTSQEKIGLLTDVHNDACKNFFQHVFIIELKDETIEAFEIVVGERVMVKKKEEFKVDYDRSASFPVDFPNGGNPLKAQGIYPLPCYLAFDSHIKSFADEQELIQKFLLPRFNRTVPYMDEPLEERERLAEKIAQVIVAKAPQFIKEDKAKQLGIVCIVDHRLPFYSLADRLPGAQQADQLWVTQSRIYKDKHIILAGDRVVEYIMEAKLREAATLGEEHHAISTFTNQRTEHVVSIYNKSWLWLSPTFDNPKSIYWKDDEWTKGIKVDRQSYEYFVYGSQFFKFITKRISSHILKEMFAPVDNAEAKQHMKPTSIEAIYGAPVILPLLDQAHKLSFQIVNDLVKDRSKDESKDPRALHLDVIAGLDHQISHLEGKEADQYRMTLIYYSGDFSRGNMHIRAVIEDVVPSVAKQIDDIIDSLTTSHLSHIQQMFNMKEELVFRLQSLPAMLANAYGPGYIWSALQHVLHRGDIGVSRLTKYTARKLNELANKKKYWAMRQELVFYYGFLYFVEQYQLLVQNKEKGVMSLSEWKEIARQYYEGKLSDDVINTADGLGYAAGLFLRQFSNSYHHKTGKDFVEHRVMKFGSKLTPEMIWTQGIKRAPELGKQWDLRLGSNFYSNIPMIVEGFVRAHQSNMLVSEQDVMISAFWAGYFSYKSQQQA